MSRDLHPIHDRTNPRKDASSEPQTWEDTLFRPQREDLEMGRTKNAHRNSIALAQQERQSTEQVPFFGRRREAKMS